MSRDPEVVKGRADDPLVHDRITPALYFGMEAARFSHRACRNDSYVLPKHKAFHANESPFLSLPFRRNTHAKKMP